jgi:hypothetical protein
VTAPDRVEVEVNNYLAGQTYARGFIRESQDAWNHASENYAIDIGKRAIDKANSDRRRVVDVPDIEDAIASLNSSARVAALFTIGGILAGIAATAIISVIIAEHNKAFWWIIGVSIAVAATAIAVLFAGYRTSR